MICSLSKSPDYSLTTLMNSKWRLSRLRRSRRRKVTRMARTVPNEDASFVPFIHVQGEKSVPSGIKQYELNQVLQKVLAAHARCALAGRGSRIRDRPFLCGPGSRAARGGDGV